MEETANILTLVDAPAVVEPYLHFFYNKEEVQLIGKLKKEKLPAEEIALLMQKSTDETTDLLEKAYRRYVVNKEAADGGRDLYSLSLFYNRIGFASVFENYYILPRKLRVALDEWHFQEYVKLHDHFKTVKEGDPAYEQCHNDLVLLLDELEEMIEVAPVIRVLPCDCKMLADRCDHSREVCLWFSPEMIERKTRGQDLGWELTKEEALKLVRSINKEGLMHTGSPFNWREEGPTVVCSCCTCCCYPFRAAQELGTKGKWPYSRYIAKYDPSLCSHCGRCTKRCQFKAFTFSDEKVKVGNREKKKIHFEPELCWGCGLCAETCPEKAITMEPIPGRIE